jgi:N-acyl-D-aspartate/D-glutamate deacylase
MRYVLVNGVLAVEDGAPTRSLSGRVLERGERARSVS